MGNRMQRLISSVVGLTILTLGACTDDSSELPDGVLTTDDLPAEPQSAEAADFAESLVSSCDIAAEGDSNFHPDERRIVAFAGVGSDDVTSAVYSVTSRETREELVAWLDLLRTGYQECVDATTQGGSGTAEETIRLDELGADSFGYSVVRTGSEEFSGSRAYAVVGTVVVQVSVYHDGPGTPAINASDLLNAAVSRATAEFATAT